MISDQLTTATAGIQHEDEIAGLILRYPAFGMHDIMNDGRSIEDIPEAFDLGGLYVGRIFIEDLWRYDVRDDLPDFDKPVLMLLGSEDDIVRPEVPKRRASSIPTASII